MNYEQLKRMMSEYHVGTIDRKALKMAIALWQLKTYGRIA